MDFNSSINKTPDGSFKFSYFLIVFKVFEVSQFRIQESVL